jgi:GNAT superfamily N-acetyltransferase
MSEAVIRPMTVADVGPAADMIRRGEWGDRSVFLRWAIGFGPSHLFVADDSGEVVGTGIATANGTVGWVGTIFVDRDRRREGLGSRLTSTVIDDLEARGCRTLALIATEDGRPLYERLGFSRQVPQVRFTTTGLPSGPTDGAIRAFEPRMLPDLVALDRLATGEDRATLIGALATPDSTRVVVGDDEAVRGFVIRAPWGGVALVAPDADDACLLLDWRRRQAGPGHDVHAGLPDGQESRRARLLADGWAPAGGGTRMIRGEALDWHPDWIWGTLSGALG